MGTTRRAWTAAGTAAVAILCAAAPAGAHSSAAKGGDEQRLRAIETRELGPEHAAEHAAMRRLARAVEARERRHAAWLRRLPRAQRRREIARERAARRRSLQRVKARASLAGPPELVGQWTSGPASIPVMGINAAVLPTGKVLFWAYPTNPNPLYNPAYKDIADAPNNSLTALWDPATGASKVIEPPINPDTGRPTNLWCSGISFLADGRVLATGGNLGYSPDWRGLQRVYAFDPWKETWTEQGRMRHGRWYPSQALLADGRTLILQGYDETGTQTYNKDVEVFDAQTGQVKLLGQLGDKDGNGNYVTPPVGGYYPHMFLMPSGRLLIAGPDRGDSWLFNNPGNDLSWTSIPHTNMTEDRQWGTAVLLPGGPNGSTRVMQIGGSPFRTNRVDQPDPTPSTEIFDEANPAGGWRTSSSLNVARSHANTVLLPDGSMVEIGGGRGTTAAPAPANQYALSPSQAEKQVELFDPNSGQWRLGPAQAEARAYHSTAVLLPDGRVASAGDDFDGPGGPGTGLSSDTVEVYSPPYLFKGARPAITSAPSAVRWGTTFGVGTPNADVTRAVLMAPDATTHATDMNQSSVQLPLARRADGLGVDVTAPTSANVAPPGYYMLFLLNDRGVPSVASWIRLGADAPPPPALVAQGTSAPAPAPAAGGAAPPAASTPSGGARSARPAALPVKLRVAKRVRYRDLLRGGITLRISCQSACTVRASLVAGRKVRLRGKSRVLAAGRRTKAAKKVALRVRPTAVAKQLRKRRSSAAATLRIRLRGADGRTASVSRGVLLVRR